MRLPRLLSPSFLALVLSALVTAQTTPADHPPSLGADGMYAVAFADLKRLDSSPALEFPPRLTAYEVADRVVVSFNVSPEGKVVKAKAISGEREELKDLAEKTVKRWLFQPYVVNGAPAPVRSEVPFKFNNTLDDYRDPSGDVPIHLDTSVSKTLPTKKVPPEYPSDARSARIQGAVDLRVIVGADGHVHAMHIVRGHPLLAPAAFNAVRRWEFKPYMENGKTYPVDITVTINFALH